MKILLLTVGDSLAPLVTSIRQNKPDHIVFFCSNDTTNDKGEPAKGSYTVVVGEVSGDKPGILVQAGAQAVPYEIALFSDLDDLDTCYKESLDKLLETRKEHPGAALMADYTGGTKSMAAGLAMAATDVKGVTICLVTGERRDLVKVLDGTQSIRLERSETAYLNRQLAMVDAFVAGYDYAAAAKLLNRLLHSASGEMLATIQERLKFCRAFDAWDQFDHPEAYRLLKQLDSYDHTYLDALDAILTSRAKLDDQFRTKLPEEFSLVENAHGYEVAGDLLRNAERRAHQRHYDDAVARFYRLTELTGQLLLHHHHHLGLQEGKLNVKTLPSELQPEYTKRSNSKGLMGRGLWVSFDLLGHLDPFGVGEILGRRRAKLMKVLRLRNNSILAHGFTPINPQEYQQMGDVITGFVEEIFATIGVSIKATTRQLPTSFDGQ